jgi:putative ABC transport system substrate-binding protein
VLALSNLASQRADTAAKFAVRQQHALAQQRAELRSSDPNDAAVRRREFITLLGGAAAAWPLTAHAQQRPMPVIGLLGAASPHVGPVAANLAAWRAGLGETGYVEGQNVRVEYRWADGRYDRLPALAADLVNRKVEVIVTEGGDPSTLAAKRATSTIPIVFHTTSDPVELGLVASLARPGGNLTGVSMLRAELMPKLLDLLLELVPHAKMIALLVNPNNPLTGGAVRDMLQAALAKGVQLDVQNAGTEGEIEASFAGLAQRHPDGVILASDGFFTLQRIQLVALAARHAVPAIYTSRPFVEAGGLICYGASLIGAYRLKGIYTGKILQGAKAADLPVQQPTTFELIINLKTAKALGLTVPLRFQQLADE